MYTLMKCFTCVLWASSTVFSIQVNLEFVCVSVCWCREVMCSFSLPCKLVTRSPKVFVSDLPFSNKPAKIHLHVPVLLNPQNQQ